MSGRMAMGGVLILVCVCTARSSPPTALDQLDALAEQLGQVQVDLPLELPNAQDLQAATKVFMPWQVQMIGQREQLQRSYSRLLKERTKVPPAPTPDLQQPPPMTRLDVPLPFPTDLQLSLSYGQAQVAFNVRAQTKVMSFVGASYKAGVGYCASDHKWLVADALQISTGLFGTKVEPAWTMQMYSSVWGQPDPAEGRPKGAELSVELAKVKGVIGYDSDGHLSLGAGYNTRSTPKALGRWLDASFGICAEASAPVKVQGLTRGRPTLSSRLSRSVARLVRYMIGPRDCPHCQGWGRIGGYRWQDV